MEKITFTQRYYKKSVILAITYILALGIITFAIWKWNFGIKNLINALFPESIPRWFIVIACLLPLIYFIKFTIRDIYISFELDKIIVEDNKIIEIPIRDIQYVQVNDPRDATINLYSLQGLLYTFDGFYEDEEVLSAIEKNIVERGNFKRIDSTKKILNTQRYITKYIKK